MVANFGKGALALLLTERGREILAFIKKTEGDRDRNLKNDVQNHLYESCVSFVRLFSSVLSVRQSRTPLNGSLPGCHSPLRCECGKSQSRTELGATNRFCIPSFEYRDVVYKRKHKLRKYFFFYVYDVFFTPGPSQVVCWCYTYYFLYFR